MKKFVYGLIAVCLVLVIGVGFFIARGTQAQRTAVAAAQETLAADPTPEVLSASQEEASDAEVTESEETDAETPAEAVPASTPEEQTVLPGHLDYDAIFALHAADEPVLTVGGAEERWGDYFYLLFTQAGQIENYFDAMSAYYGMQFAWGDSIEEDSNETYADVALESAESLTIQLRALELFAEENGVELDDAILEEIAAQKEEDAVAALGEGATAEEFQEYLDGIYLTPEMYDRILTQNHLYQESFNALYGEDAAQFPEELALEYLEKNGYVTAAHILLRNTDTITGEDLDEETLAARKEALEVLREEFSAIEDPEERAEAFLKAMKTTSEDTGLGYYPEGYTYTAGSMVTEFEDAVEALEDYELSDVVETVYGYHLIMRLPLSPDAILEYGSTTGTARTARMLAANEDYSVKLQALADSLELVWLPDCEEPDLLSFVAE